MKKFISGVIVGLFLFAGASVFADSSSLIGQKVQGLFSVEKSGTKIADAVIINGSAYAPVRAVAQAAGVELTVEGKTIKMSQEPQVVSSSVSATPAPSVEPATSKPTPSPEKEKENKIVSLNGKLATISVSITMAEIQLKDDPANETLKQKVTDLKAQYAEIEAQLAELQK
ncbi:hypothetical protein [Paenibacillus wynnii]|uniref:Copper amine oxidase-like N-terminal domain-containing protein n=1 Tax=Paenibacillus wynnii TaxID=268407 RepID=A0A098MEU5_9BACL|nr:hypothetical protein [Paenibacillus wynnii]KGE20062.1 hypothetical protein PWYN_12470 [Paenibacillus wynnii]